MSVGGTLAENLHIGDVDDDELSTVLSGILPRGAQFRPDEVEYRTRDDETALSLRYRKGAIFDAVAGPAMTPEIEARLREKIEQDLLVESGNRVCRWTMFSGREVTGWWRHDDEFQIVPAPPEAPRPGTVIGDHPFIIDFVFRDSTNFRVRNLRYARKAYELELLLDLLLRTGISAPASRARHHWVFAPHGMDPPVLWVNEGYMIQGFQYLVDDFPPTGTLSPLTVVESETYYDPIEGYTDTLTVPSALGRLLDTFGALGQDDRARFLRACYWHHMSETMWNYSQSLHITSLVNSIECLASVRAERLDPEGPSNLFKTFMKLFAPGKPSGSTIDRLYYVRGQITHGERLLHYDRPPSAASLSEMSARDREASDSAVRLCKGALLNWLWSQKLSASEDALLKRGQPKSKPAKPGTKSAVEVIVPGE